MTTSDIAALAWAQTWQLTSLIVVVALAARLWRKRRPHLAHVLWLVVLAKCLTPPVIASSGSLSSWLQPARTIAGENAGWTDMWNRSGPESPLSTLDNSSSLASQASGQFEPRSQTPFGNALVEAPASNSVQPGNVSRDSAKTPDEAAELRNARSQAELGSEGGEKISSLSRFGEVLRWGGRIWLTGSIAFIAVALVRWGACLRRVRAAAVVARPDLDSLVADLSRRLRVGLRVRLIVTECRIGPAVVGLFRPVILLPAMVVCGKSARELEAIVAHELIHVRRGDLWIGLVQVAAQGVWWFHPLVWLANRRATRAAEACCDEEVIAELGCDPASYAGSLLEILELKRRLVSVPAFPGMRPVDITRERLERIMQLGQGSRRATPWWCWIVLVLTAAATLPGAALVVSAEEEAKPPAPASPADSVAEAISKKHSSDNGPEGSSSQQKEKRPRVNEQRQIGSFNVRIVDKEQTQPKADRTTNAELHTVSVTFCPLNADKKSDQTITMTAERIQVVEESEGTNESPSEFELDGSVTWSLGDVTASAQRGKFSIVPSNFSKDGPHSQAFITLTLSGETRWKSEGFNAGAEKLTATFGVRGSQAMPKIGVYDLQLAQNASMNGHKDEFIATAERIHVSFFDRALWPPLEGKSVTGRPCEISLNGNASLRRSWVDTKMSAISADSIVCDGRRGGMRPFENLLVAHAASPRTRQKMKGIGVNSDAGIVGTIAVDANVVPETRSDRNDVLSTVTYSVADLVVPAPDLIVTVSPTEDAKTEENSNRQNSAKYVLGRLRLRPARYEANSDGHDHIKANLAPLIRLITDSIAPASWDEVGGPGSIRVFGMTLSLVVRQTQTVHDEIAELLKKLRQIQGLQTLLNVEVFHHATGAPGAPGHSFDETLSAEAAKRGVDLSQDQLRAFREYIKADDGKWTVDIVKLTLHNGQGAELVLCPLWPARPLWRTGVERPPLIQLNSVISADKSTVRLHVAAGAMNAVDALARSRTFTVKDGQPLLLDVSDDIKAGRLGLPIVEPLGLNDLLQKARTTEPARASERTLLLITPHVVVSEEQQRVKAP